MALSFSSSLQTPTGRFTGNRQSSPAGNRYLSSSSSFRVRRAFHPVSAAASSAPAPTRRHWKQGEFPGRTQPSESENRRNATLKNAKKKLERKENATAWANTVTEALSDAISNKQWQRSLQVFEMLKQQSFYSPKEGTYMKLLVLLGKSEQPDLAHQLFDEMLEQGIPPTAELYTALLGAYCRSGLIDKAFKILDVMKSLPQCQPDVFTYSGILKACVDASRFDLVDSIYIEMDRHSISPNTVTQNIVLSGYCRAELYDQMEKVLSSMLQNPNSKPDVWTMNIIIAIFGNRGQIELMEQWYEKFRDYGVSPETRTFNILIGAYGKARRYDKMSSVMEYMRKLEFPWTSSTYNNVIEAFADVGDAKNMEYTFEQMRSERMKCDSKTFACLVNGYANAGMFHKVMKTVELAARLEIPRNKSLYNAVISACAKAGDLMEMERVYVRMKEEKCEGDDMTYRVMMDAYRKEGMNDKVYYLEQEMASRVGSEENLRDSSFE
ncbi:Pentatricopeptide repeat-containing protein At3g06430, chloroplastic [Linum grandiflorum]